MIISQELVDKKVIFRLDTTKIKDIKRNTLEKETTLNDLFVEGIDCVIEKYKEFLRKWVLNIL